MTIAGSAMPLGRGPDSPGPRLRVVGGADDAGRRIEDWIVNNLAGKDGPSTSDEGRQSTDDIQLLRRGPEGRNGTTGRSPSAADWARFRTARRREITVVRLVDRALVKEAELQELADDLLGLVEAGNHRVVLNFGLVERLSSWVVGAVAEAHCRCATADGGALKVCGLQPQVAGIFSITGLDRKITLCPDEATAIDGPWPEPTAPRPLPIAVLSALTGAVTVPPPEVVEDEVEVGPLAEVTPAAEVRLIVQAGRSKGQSIAVGGPRFVIGRDPRCRLRPSSPDVSPFHAAIERRPDGRVFLRDLGSPTGTILNGRRLRGRAVQVRDGDQIGIGPLGFRLAIGPACKAADVDELVTAWVQEDGAGERFSEADPPPALEELDGGWRLKHEVIQDVLVITPRVSHLDDDSTVGPLRAALHALFEQELPRRVVVNLEFVVHLSGRAIGMLLAHHLRLDQAGGALRICQAHARIMAALDQIHLTTLMGCSPTIDEAVLASWPQSSSASNGPQ